ncbi:MAG: PQQ-dependent sugar dehydrogenase [Rhizobiaceae bacterium]
MAVFSGGDGAQTYTGTSGSDVIYGHSTADTNALSGQIGATRVVPAEFGLVFAGSHSSDTNGLYTLNKGTGTIVRTDLANGAQTTFLDIPESTFSSVGERGLLGLAFHPDYASNGRFFVFITATNGDLKVVEYSRSGTNPLAADPAPVQTIITVPHSQNSNHNGGSLAFGPDGNLYISTGDGGGSNDPDNNSQNTNSLLGKILRLNVETDAFPSDAGRNYSIPSGNVFAGVAGADEIFDYGLRNPWRMSFDRATGDLWIGDVGQNAQEEIDVHRAGVASGLNFGWRIREGELPGIGTGTGPFEEPVQVFDRTDARSITGGYVYRGPGTGMQGSYVFADFATGNVWALLQKPGGLELIDITDRINSAGINIESITSFGESSDGSLFVVTFGGGVFKLSFDAASGDGNDILSGGGGADSIYGGAGNDQLNGDGGVDALVGGIGNDTLNGGVDGDNLWGGAGADQLTGGDGTGVDYARYDDSNWGNLVIRLDAPDLNTGVASADTYVGIEGLVGGAGNDTVAGNSAANFLFGSGGDDKIFGQAGADYLNGGAGADQLWGGTGADQHVGGSDTAIDYARYDDANWGNLTLRLDNSTLNAGAASTGDTYVDIEGLVAGLGNDTIIGNASGNFLFGAAGSDFMDGRDGNDYLNGGAGADRFRFATTLNATTNVDRVADFASGTDDLLLLQSVFASIGTTLDATELCLGTAAADANDYLIYNSTNGQLFYDANGNGAGGQILFATLTAGTVLNIGDFVMV